MKISLHEEFKKDANIVRILMDYIPEFSAEHKIPKQYKHNIIINPKGRKMFCDWLNTKYFKSIRPYSISLGGDVISEGFEIDDNEAVLLLLKVSD